MTKKCFKILCIDGGGIKGVFSASVLARYEELYGVRMTDYFDLIAGTSTGGIIALGASLGIPMANIVQFYEKHGPIIFDQTKPPHTCIGKCMRKLKLGIKQAVCKSKYDNKNLETALCCVFEKHTLKDSNNLLCIPAYNITAARNRIFKKDYGKYNTDNNLSYVDVALATAAAPTYFPIKEIDNVQYIDGGLWALNPTLAALTEFIRNFYKKEPPYDYDSVSILSISSCETNIQDYAPKKNRSFREWKDTLFDIYTDGQNQSVNFFVQHIQPHLPFIDIVRVKNDSLSPQVAQYIDMDNASEDSINIMKGLGNDTAIKYKEEVVDFFKAKKTFKFLTMANNHDQFIAFNDKISADSKRDTLRQNRDALRDRIRDYYRENYPDDIQPRFHQQGSFAMHTLLNPIVRPDKSQPYDMDDGIYFVDDIKNKLSVQEYHNRIYNAVKGHTDKDPKDNDPCVTVYYADGHHIDLPIYFMEEDDEHPKLAHKALGWIDSDPREFYRWFNGIKDNEQLRRLVRYLKAWADYEELTNGTKMPSGCIMTILAAKYYVKNDRDDIAFKDLLVAMHVALSDKFECLRPTFPVNEDLFAGTKWATRKFAFMKALGDFKDDAVRSINSKNPHDACLKWQLHFGDRFCCSSAPDRDEDAIVQESAGPKLNNSRFA